MATLNDPLSESFFTLLEDAQAMLGVPLPSQQQTLWANYLGRLWEANGFYNYFSRKMSREDLVRLHVLDCAWALPHLPISKVTADLGSGGGLPGILFALYQPHTRFLLYERSHVKRTFLTGLRDLSPNIKVKDTLDIDGLDGSCDLVIARAFKPLAVILELTPQYLNQGGSYVLLKGRRQQIDRELAAANKLLGSAHVEVKQLETHGLWDERHLVLVNC